MEERRSGMHEVSDDYYISHEHPEYNVFMNGPTKSTWTILYSTSITLLCSASTCMPSSDDFCRFISWDHYGERFYAENMPERHRYEANWHPSPPEISDEQLEAYKRLEATITGKGDISPLAMSIVSPHSHSSLGGPCRRASTGHCGNPTSFVIIPPKYQRNTRWQCGCARISACSPGRIYMMNPT